MGVLIVKPFLFYIIALVFLSSCGGGGGSSAPDNKANPSLQTDDKTPTTNELTNSSAFEQRSLVVNIATDMIQNTCASDGVQQQFLVPVNLNYDSQVDFIAHYWCGRTDFHVFDDGPTPDLLVAYVSNSDGSYNQDNLTHFGVSNPRLGGASRNLDTGDLNGDTVPDIAFAVNREDLRSMADVDTIAARPALLLSNAVGYDVQNMGIADWIHAVGINENKVIFSGFNMADAQVFTYNDGSFEDSTTTSFSGYNPGAFDAYEDFIIQGTDKNVDGKSFVGFELLQSDGTRLDEFLFEENFKIQREIFGGGEYEERIVYSKENGDLFFDSLANEVEIFESNGEMLAVAIFDTHIFSGDGPLVSNQNVSQDQMIPKKEIFLFKVENDLLISKNKDIDYVFGDDFVQFLDVGDLNNDGLLDLQFSVVDDRYHNPEVLIDGIPRVFLNDGNNGFDYVDDSKFITTPLSQDGSGRGFVYDINGDQTLDFVRFTFISKIQEVKIEIYLGESNFYE